MAKSWYILRVQSNREKRAHGNLVRRIEEAPDDIREKFGQAMIPTERVTEIKAGKKQVVTRKKYPGYVMLEIEPLPPETTYDPESEEPEPEPEELERLAFDRGLVQQAWSLVRETPCVGDFVGAYGAPVPMGADEVMKMLNDETTTEDAPKLDIRFAKGDNVKITHGPFDNFEGSVEEVDGEKGRVRVIVTIFGRQTPLDLEYWEVEPS